MRCTQPALAAPPAALLLAALALFSSPPGVAAHPYPLQNTNGNNFDAGFRFIMPRDCVQRCGSDGQYCCGSGEECFTSVGIAGCSGGSGGNYGIFTTTWTETNTFTSTVTTPFPAEPTKEHGGGDVGGSGVCVPQTEGETSCGTICCAKWQQCASEADSQCEERPGYGGGGGLITTTVTDGNGHTITTRYSAPYRVTSTTFTNSAGSATSTGSVGTGTAIPNEGDNGEDDGGTGGGGLSAGAIAGIVIGTLAGIALLMLLCFCCIARGLWALLCGGKKKDDRRRERTEVYEEHYRGGAAGSRMPSTHSRRDRHGGWFGGRPASAGARRDPEKDRSSGAKWLGLGAGAATLLALLNLRKDKKKPERKARSRYTDSYYSYTDSESSRSRGGAPPPRRASRAPMPAAAGSRRYDDDQSDLTSYLGGSSAGRTNRTRRTEQRSGSRYSRR